MSRQDADPTLGCLLLSAGVEAWVPHSACSTTTPEVGWPPCLQLHDGASQPLLVGWGQGPNFLCAVGLERSHYRGDTADLGKPACLPVIRLLISGSWPVSWPQAGDLWKLARLLALRLLTSGIRPVSRPSGQRPREAGPSPGP